LQNLIAASTADGAPMPGWLAATQRSVELSISQAAAHFSEGTSHPAVRGLTSALRTIGEIVHASCQKEKQLPQPAAEASGEGK
jgi:pyruvate/oxaloacetate carboxyltransferase